MFDLPSVHSEAPSLLTAVYTHQRSTFRRRQPLEICQGTERASRASTEAICRPSRQGFRPQHQTESYHDTTTRMSSQKTVWRDKEAITEPCVWEPAPL